MKKLLFFLLILLTACVPLVEQEARPASFEEYYCESRNLIRSCSDGLSSTTKSCYEFNEQGVRKRYVCYEGWKPYNVEIPEMPYRCGKYHCYPALDFCLYGGDINKPKVPSEEVCDLET